MWQFFTDPVLQAPTIGSMLMCFVASLCGAFSVLRKQSLVGETLSHACYPGVILAFILFQNVSSLWVPLIGGAVSCLAGMWFIEWLQKRARVTADSALCLILASFFGIGIFLLTCVQLTHPTLYRQLQSYLFGQAATMTEENVNTYLLLSGLLLGLVVVFFRQIKLVIFDAQFAQAANVNVVCIQFLLFSLSVTSVVIAIRSVGVVLMSAMLVFPCVIARQWTDRLSPLLVLASIFGVVSGFFGVYFSHTLSFELSFPTGPMIVLSASALFFVSSLIAPKKGLCVRLVRRWTFLRHCQQENFLKMLWKQEKHEISKGQVPLFLRLSLRRKGWLRKNDKGNFELTASGMLWGKKIVRLHRLWELYLVEYCGLAKERVHPSAEEMEHILTPEIEQELLRTLRNPVQDPHQQPIPSL